MDDIPTEDKHLHHTQKKKKKKKKNEEVEYVCVCVNIENWATVARPLHMD
jgi:hypothetical protein